MNGPGAVWQLAAAKWSEVFAQVGDDQWAATTPCEGWTVRDLVDHCMHWQGVAAQTFGGGAAPGDDWGTIQPALAAGLADPANLEGVSEALGGMPKHQMAGLATADLLIHSWDLARSIGADETLPAEAVEAVMMGLQRMGDGMRGTAFGEAVEVADDASAQDKLIAFSGRQP